MALLLSVGLRFNWADRVANFHSLEDRTQLIFKISLYWVSLRTHRWMARTREAAIKETLFSGIRIRHRIVAFLPEVFRTFLHVGSLITLELFECRGCFGAGFLPGKWCKTERRCVITRSLSRENQQWIYSCFGDLPPGKRVSAKDWPVILHFVFTTSS